MTPLRLGTRASLLARTQADDVARALRAAGHPVELVPMTSDGDTNRASLASLGGTGVFAAALREALLEGRCDLVVHSYKDLPTLEHPGLAVAAVPPRADPRDVLCSRAPLDRLPTGARIGTGSPRRRAQLLRRRPDLDVVDIRGNVDTRLAMVSDGVLDGVVLAAAGLGRIGREDRVVERFDWPTAPAQGALAIEVRAADAATTAVVRTVHDEATATAVVAERAVLAHLGAGCAAPVAATASVTDGRVSLRAAAYSLDGVHAWTATVDGDPADPSTLGVRAATELVAAGATAWTDR